uniref:Tubulin polyglutamylase ttll6 n=2 Tax=Macrostomum lignano TaxID=282301 RepID=A0A1I8J724_9PLAT
MTQPNLSDFEYNEDEEEAEEQDENEYDNDVDDDDDDDNEDALEEDDEEEEDEEDAGSADIDAEEAGLTLVDDPSASVIVSTKFSAANDGDLEEVDEEAGEDEGEDVLEPAQRATEVDTRTSVEPSRPAAIATAADEAQSIESSVMQQPSVSAKRKRRKKVYTICLTNCQYDVVRNSAKNFGLVEVEEEEEWSIFWTDLSVTLERVCAMKAYQKINHFPGMSEICRKDGLGRNLSRMQKLFPKEFNIAPKTWILPSDWSDLQAFARTKRNKTYILKPESSCQGKGIWCTRNVKDIKPGEHQVCQLYLTRPFLIDGYKFDLRIYVLITSCDPLRIFVFKEGLARFTTVKYKDPCGDNMGNVYMHLTNYAVQKGSKEFVRNDEEGGTKRRLTTINRWLESNGYDLQQIWADIDDAIIKTVLSAHSVLKHNYRTCFPTHMRGSACFEILGFDVILDRRMKPFVLEVNHSPSFATDSRLDREIKEALITDTFGLINLGAVDRRKILEEERRRVRDRLTQRNNKKESREDQEREAAKFAESQERYELQHLGNYRRIYPGPDTDARYQPYLAQAASLYQETTATKARAECAKQQREKLTKKQEKPLAAPAAAAGGVRRPQRARARVPGVQGGDSRTPVGGGQTSPASEELVVGSGSGWEPESITDSEEIERLSGLLQRDSLVRGLGVADQLRRLLLLRQQSSSFNRSATRDDEDDGGASGVWGRRYLDELSVRLGAAAIANGPQLRQSKKQQSQTGFRKQSQQGRGLESAEQLRFASAFVQPLPTQQVLQQTGSRRGGGVGKYSTNSRPPLPPPPPSEFQWQLEASPPGLSIISAPILHGSQKRKQQQQQQRGRRSSNSPTIDRGQIYFG